MYEICITCFWKDELTDKCRTTGHVINNSCNKHITRTGHEGVDYHNLPSLEICRDMFKLDKYFKEQSNLK